MPMDCRFPCLETSGGTNNDLGHQPYTSYPKDRTWNKARQTNRSHGAARQLPTGEQLTDLRRQCMLVESATLFGGCEVPQCRVVESGDSAGARAADVAIAAAIAVAALPP